MERLIAHAASIPKQCRPGTERSTSHYDVRIKRMFEELALRLGDGMASWRRGIAVLIQIRHIRG